MTADNLSGRTIVLGVCGGIAAYKAVELCRRLTDAGAQVVPVLTESATRFVGAATFAAVAAEAPRRTLWDSPEPSPHTTLAKRADLVIVAPATARLLSDYASGRSVDLLSATLLATRAPVVICPAMHTEMWEHPAVQDNLQTLRSRGVAVVEPESGALAGGDDGMGRLASIDPMIAAASSALLPAPPKMTGRHVLVTAGGTREPIDPVRYVGNRSSGRQGHAIAAEAIARGAEVTLITTSSEAVPEGATAVHVETAQQMHDAVIAAQPLVDSVIMAAAVADFMPEVQHQSKWKRSKGTPEIRLVPTPDILQAVAAQRKDDQVIVGFAAETDDVEGNARAKLEDKKLDLIVANDVTEEGAGFGHSTNSVLIIEENGQIVSTGVVGKRTVAATLLDAVGERLAKNAN